jgi:hypothetical protein
MRLRSVLIAAGAVAAAVVPGGQSASALGTCSVVGPTTAVLDRELVHVPYRLAGDCAVAGAVYASWDVVHPSDGVTGGLTFDGAMTATWDLYDWMGPARYTVRPWSALDVDSVPLTQNSAHTTVKLGSRLTATVSRSDGRLTFGAYARVYSPTVGDWYRRAGVNVSVVHLPPGSSTWTWVKAAATSSTGRVTLSVVPKAGQYRLMVKETGTVWASYSSTVRGT